MNEKLAEAMGHVDRKYVEEAGRKKRKGRRLLAATAAVLVLVMLFNLPTIPMAITAKAVALPTDSRAPEWRGPDDRRNTYDSYDEHKAVMDAAEASINAAMEDMAPFFTEGSVQFLTGTDGNALWSPVNAAIALSMLAETASGTTRQEVLDLLGIGDIETLREAIARIWENGNKEYDYGSKSMANSLWVDRDMKYDQSVMDTLAYDYYASVYQGKLGSAMTNNAIQTWVNNNTDGFLKQMSDGIDISPSPDAVATVMALVSTVYLVGPWQDEFIAEHNTGNVFHSPGGDRLVTYMNKEENPMYYYWGESYGAVYLGMKNGTGMWLILPDEDKTTAQVLAEGEYLGMFADRYEYPNSKYMEVNLSVPKFDISKELDLVDGLKEMGLHEVFDITGGDFGSTFGTDLPIFINQVKQASRVSINENGVTAASYIILDGNGAMAPPEDIVDFVLDRPFIFAITSDAIPMFVGVVNEP